jgi:hypothetical protein
VRESCSICNWTNASLLNIGEVGAPKLICRGCVQRMERELAGTKAEWFKLLSDGSALVKKAEAQRDKWREVAEGLDFWLSWASDPEGWKEKLVKLKEESK